MQTDCRRILEGTAQLYDTVDMLAPEARSHTVVFISSITQHTLPKAQLLIFHLQLHVKYEHINSERACNFQRILEQSHICF